MRQHVSNGVTTAWLPYMAMVVAAAKHLPSAIIFVMDLSGTSGALSSPLAQLRVRELIREALPDRPWLDVRSKADLPMAEEVEGAVLPEGLVHVSVTEGMRVEELKDELAKAARAAGKLMLH